jgi:hypothetical protein
VIEIYVSTSYSKVFGRNHDLITDLATEHFNITSEKGLHDAEVVLGSVQDPDFGGGKWQEFCVSSGESGGFHDKTTYRQVAPHTQNFSPHTRDLIWKRALSARGERTASSVKGAVVHTRSSPVLMEEMFDMRPRTRPLSASSARAAFSPFEVCTECTQNNQYVQTAWTVTPHILTYSKYYRLRNEQDCLPKHRKKRKYFVLQVCLCSYLSNYSKIQMIELLTSTILFRPSAINVKV